jgi:hypothetical protein
LIAASGLAVVCLAQGQDSETALWSTLPSIFDCNPKTLGKGQPLILTMGPKHGKELAVRRVADNKWYFLVVGSPPPEMHPLMTPEQFAKSVHVELAAGFTGLDWSLNGAQTQVFTRPGKYVIYSSDILESEVGGFRCTVMYRG